MLVEVLILALALSMDAFAVSLGLGLKTKAFRVAFYFGLFQGFMPLIGLFIGLKSIEYIVGFDHWIAFGILSLIGFKMIYESMQKRDKKPQLSHKRLLLLAIATSIDALAAGFTLTFFDLSPYISVLIIAIVTAVLSFIGVKISLRVGVRFGKAAEMFGGIILILISIKILIEHSSTHFILM